MIFRVWLSILAAATVLNFFPGFVTASGHPIERVAPRTEVSLSSSSLVLPSTIKVKRVSLNRVDSVDFKFYTKRVLPNEWYGSWPIESLKAGAIATKMYAWYWMNSGGHPSAQPSADICDTASCQVYNESTYDNLGVYKASVDAAVEDTWSTAMLRGGVLFQPQYWNGRVIVYRTSGTNLRIRSAPGLGATIVTGVAEGTQLKVVGSGYTEMDGYKWWEVASWDNLVHGYVAGYYLQTVDVSGQPSLDDSGMAGRLSQWGTEYWARQGKNFEDILRKFYGDIQFINVTAGEPSPFITSSLRINESPPYYVGQTISARFTIANKGTTPITFDVLTIGGRDPDNQVADFNWHRNITLNPNESYNYEGSLALAKVGNYHFFCTYRSPDGSWNTSIPTEGLANNILDISVKAKPMIARSPSSFSFTVTEGEANPSSQTLSVWNSGSGTLYWQVSDDATWLTLKPANGSSTGDTDVVSVSVSTSGMSLGTYQATIAISAAGASNTPQIVPVTLTVQPTPESTVVSVYPSAKEVSSGVFVISINIDPKLPIAGAQFDLSFDSSLVAATEVKEGNLLNQHGASTYFKTGNMDNKIGTITGVAGVITSPGQTVSSSGTLATVTFSAGPTEGISPLTLSNVIVSDINGNPLPIIVSDGSITVSPYEDWDVSIDGAINVLDMIRVGQRWGESDTAGWIREDVNKDGTVNVLDMILIGQHWTG